MAYSAIVKPQDYFNTKLYSGNSSTQSITGVGFAPDFVWIKDRNDTGHHQLLDAVRGVTKYISSNDTDAEATSSNGLTSFNSDGFSLGDNTNYNNSSRIYASWNWKANGTGSANTAGDLNSTVSVNTTAGFSIVTYSGTGNFGESVGHGLGVVPSMIIARRLNGVEDWAVYHKALEASTYITLNTTGAEQGSTSRWGGVAPTNSVFTVGNNASVNANGGTHVAYCFAGVQGYSKFGRYDGNNSDDGPFIYTGFKPAFVIIKSYSTNPWILLDNKRGSYNVNQSKLFPNDSVAENNDTSNGIDFLSNGLKIRRNNSEINASGTAYIYMAFAENPLVANSGTDGVPATAR